MTEPAFIKSTPLTFNGTLLVTLFIAAVTHALFMFIEINFSKPKADENSIFIKIMPIILEAKKAPERAESPAQNNQISESNTRQRLISQKRSEQKIAKTQQVKKTSATNRPKLSMDVLRQQLTQLGEKIRHKKPSSDQKRIKPIDSFDTHKYHAAQYATDWKSKVENMGNLNYPAIAKRSGFSSSLTMAVGIKPDGSIYSMRISESSGYPALDQAAKRIVRLSEPFPPLPKALLQEADVVVITQVWKFSDEPGL